MAVKVVTSMDEFGKVSVGLGIEQSGVLVYRPGGSLEGQGESASVSTVAASLGGN
jgi:hypothetical protein